MWLGLKKVENHCNKRSCGVEWSPAGNLVCNEMTSSNHCNVFTTFAKALILKKLQHPTDLSSGSTQTSTVQPIRCAYYPYFLVTVMQRLLVFFQLQQKSQLKIVVICLQIFFMKVEGNIYVRAQTKVNNWQNLFKHETNVEND